MPPAYRASGPGWTAKSLAQGQCCGKAEILLLFLLFLSLLKLNFIYTKCHSILALLSLIDWRTCILLLNVT